MEEKEQIIVKEPAGFPWLSIASEKQYFLQQCRTAYMRIDDVRRIYATEDEEIAKECASIQLAITNLHDHIVAWYEKNPQQNYPGGDNENEYDQTAVLTRIKTYCGNLECTIDWYREKCPQACNHLYLAMAELIDAADDLAEYHGRKGPKGLDTLGSYLSFAAFLSNPENLRNMAKSIIENQPKQL